VKRGPARKGKSCRKVRRHMPVRVKRFTVRVPGLIKAISGTVEILASGVRRKSVRTLCRSRGWITCQTRVMTGHKTLITYSVTCLHDGPPLNRSLSVSTYIYIYIYTHTHTHTHTHIHTHTHTSIYKRVVTVFAAVSRILVAIYFYLG
jgi:hypothetical protein